MSILTSPGETIDERVDRLVQSHSETWPPLHSTTTHAAIGELIRRVIGLEEALHEVAHELELLESERDRLAAHPRSE